MWKPIEHEIYYFYKPNGEIAVQTFGSYYICDLENWKLGNCFQTKEEAKTKGKAIVEALLKEYKKA